MMKKQQRPSKKWNATVKDGDAVSGGISLSTCQFSKKWNAKVKDGDSVSGGILLSTCQFSEK